MNDLLDWCERRTCRCSWNTATTSHMLLLPSLQYLAQIRDLHSTRHKQPCPDSCITQAKHRPNSSAQTAGEGEVARAPHPCWYFTWRAGCLFSEPRLFPCAMNHLQTGFNLVPWGCRHLKARQASQQASYYWQEPVTCPACSPSLGLTGRHCHPDHPFLAHCSCTVRPGDPIPHLTGDKNNSI